MRCVDYPATPLGFVLPFLVTVFVFIDYDFSFVIKEQQRVRPFFEHRRGLAFELEFVTVVCTDFVRLFELSKERMRQNDNIDSVIDDVSQKVQEFPEFFSQVRVSFSVSEIFDSAVLCVRAYLE